MTANSKMYVIQQKFTGNFNLMFVKKQIEFRKILFFNFNCTKLNLEKYYFSILTATFAQLQLLPKHVTKAMSHLQSN